MSLKHTASGEFSVASWEEQDLAGDWSGLRMAKIDAEFVCKGEIEGTLLVAYYMTYGDKTEDPHDRTAQYAGYLAFDGSLNGKKGTCTFQDSGVYREGSPFSAFSVVHDSGKGALAGLVGHGLYYADGDVMRIKLEYEIA
ncbi:MAG TPA: DUF3224 domain-containing protein [Fastidiosipila sp.]|jgi:hypothetical protein|nr:DUF3224 domain-containing protein [Fastidiosipila sp.]